MGSFSAQSTTNETLQARLNNLTLEYAQTMPIADALEKAAAQVAKEVLANGPDANDLGKSLDEIYENQRKYYPNFQPPRFRDPADNPNISAEENAAAKAEAEKIRQERYRYSQECLNAQLNALKNQAQRDYVFHDTAKQLFKPEELRETNGISRRRWMQHLMMLNGVDGDEKTCREHNETVVMLVALGEKQITPEQFEEKRRDWYIKNQNYDAQKAADQAHADREKAPDLIYGMLIDRIGKAPKPNDFKKASKDILSGEAGKTQGGLDAAYKVLMDPGVYLMYNAGNCMDDLHDFGIQRTPEEDRRFKVECETASSDLQPYTIMATQVANPFNAIFDPVELLRSGVVAFQRQPGHEKDVSMLYTFSTENNRGVDALQHWQRQEALKRFALEDYRDFRHGLVPTPSTPCESDPDLTVYSRNGRTVICAREDVRLENGEFSVKFRFDVPGRYIDGSLLGDVAELWDKCEKVPHSKNKQTAAAFDVMREALSELRGVTVGEKAEPAKVAALEKKLVALQGAATMYDTLNRADIRKAKPSKGGKDPGEKLCEDINKFIAGKIVQLNTVKEHNATIMQAEACEKVERDATKLGWQIPEELKDLTPMQRSVKPIEDAERERQAQLAEEKRLQEEAEAKARTEAQVADGSKLNAELENTGKAYEQVQVDSLLEKAENAFGEKSAENMDSPVNAMITGYVNQMKQMFEGTLEAKKEAPDPESAKAYEAEAAKYGNMAIAAETVRHLWKYEQRGAETKRPIETLLKKGAMSELTQMVLKSRKFEELRGPDTPENFTKLLKKPEFYADKIGYNLMINVKKAQTAAKQNAPQNPQVQNGAPQVQNGNKSAVQQKLPG